MTDRPYYAWPGGYPLFYLCKDGGILCPKCANQEDVDYEDPNDPQWLIVGSLVNYEDEDLYCDHCSQRIEAAYE